MAEKSRLKSSSLGTKGARRRCEFCWFATTGRRGLSCAHSLCNRCFQQSRRAIGSHGNTIMCPVCQARVTFTSNRTLKPALKAEVGAAAKSGKTNSLQCCDFCSIAAKSNKQLKCKHNFCVRCFHQSGYVQGKRKLEGIPSEFPCPLCPNSDTSLSDKKMKESGLKKSKSSAKPDNSKAAKKTFGKPNSIKTQRKVITTDTKKQRDVLKKPSKKTDKTGTEIGRLKVNNNSDTCNFCCSKVVKARRLDCVHIFCGRCFQCVMSNGVKDAAKALCPLCTEDASKPNQTQVKQTVGKGTKKNGPVRKTQSKAAKVLLKNGLTQVGTRAKTVKTDGDCDFCSCKIITKRRLQCSHTLCGRCLQQCAQMTGVAGDNAMCPLCLGQTTKQGMVAKKTQK